MSRRSDSLGQRDQMQLCEGSGFGADTKGKQEFGDHCIRDTPSWVLLTLMLFLETVLLGFLQLS